MYLQYDASDERRKLEAVMSLYLRDVATQLGEGGSLRTVMRRISERVQARGITEEQMQSLQMPIT